MARKGKAAEKSAATSPNRGASELDRAIVQMRKTETMKATAEHFGVTIARVDKAEWLCRWHDEGAAMLANDPENLEGLSRVGQISSRLADVLRHCCGSSEGLDQGYFDRYPRYTRICEVLAAGKDQVRWRRGMGPKLWAEWLAFMAARGLQWEEVTNPPAGRIGDDWNIIDFPTGRARLEITTRNATIRARYFNLSRQIGAFQDLLCASAGEKNHFNKWFNEMHDSMNTLFAELQYRRILAEDRS